MELYIQIEIILKLTFIVQFTFLGIRKYSLVQIIHFYQQLISSYAAPSSAPVDPGSERCR